MEQIAEGADIARGTLYNYFPAKEAIINEYIQQSFKMKNTIRFRELQEMADTRTRMTYIFKQLISGVERQKGLFEKYLIFRMEQMVSFHQEEGIKSGFHLLGEKIIKMGQEEGEIRRDIPFYILKDLFEFAFIEAIKPLYMEVEGFDLSQNVERSIDLFLNGAKVKD